MIFSLRPFLVFVLVLLQCIAPLVHAHTGEHFSTQGLHIPELEVYTQSLSESAFETTQPILCQVSSVCSDIEGQVVGIDAGLGRDLAMPVQRAYKIIADGYCADYLVSSPTVFPVRSVIFYRPLHTPVVLSLSQFNHSPHSARAPPAYL